MRLFALTALTMLAFAGNSILNRLALADGSIAPDAFALIRLFSGALVLAVLVVATRPHGMTGWLRQGTVVGALSLAVYAVSFSFAYVGMDAGFGALLLFAVVQVTMFAAALVGRQETIGRMRWIGTLMALGGLAILLLPGSSAPPLLYALLMISGAVAWGFYTLAGKSSTDPLAATAANFVFATPVALAAWLLVPASLAPGGISTGGVFLALLSGIVTSGLGYALWYSVLPRLRTTTAALSQLTVPVTAAAGGIVLLGEALTLTFALATLLVIAGIALSLRR